MAINLKLGPVRDVHPDEDDMGRTWVGYEPTLSAQQVHDQNRGIWLLGPRAAREKHATYSFEGTIRAVVEIDHIESVSAKAAGKKDKSAVVGRVLTIGHPVHDALIGTSIDGHRNPVTYLDGPTGGARTCACGCGAPVAGHRVFAPGHDQRAVHERITRQWGSTLGFIDWFDATFPLDPPAEA